MDESQMLEKHLEIRYLISFFIFFELSLLAHSTHLLIIMFFESKGGNSQRLLLSHTGRSWLDGSKKTSYCSTLSASSSCMNNQHWFLLTMTTIALQLYPSILPWQQMGVVPKPNRTLQQCQIRKQFILCNRDNLLLCKALTKYFFLLIGV